MCDLYSVYIVTGLHADIGRCLRPTRVCYCVQRNAAVPVTDLRFADCLDDLVINESASNAGGTGCGFRQSTGDLKKKKKKKKKRKERKKEGIALSGHAGRLEL